MSIFKKENSARKKMNSSTNQSNIVVIGLLYHSSQCPDPQEKQRLDHCFSTIGKDSVLTKMIHLLPMDSSESRNWATSTTRARSGVDYYPCFVVRIGNVPAKTYNLSSCNEVFNIAHHHHRQFTGQPSSGSVDNDVLDNITTASYYKKLHGDNDSSSSSGNPAPCRYFEQSTDRSSGGGQVQEESSSSESQNEIEIVVDHGEGSNPKKVAEVDLHITERDSDGNTIGSEEIDIKKSKKRWMELSLRRKRVTGNTGSMESMAREVSAKRVQISPTVRMRMLRDSVLISEQFSRITRFTG